MAERVFWCFDYENDFNRAMTVYNNWVPQGKEASGLINKTDFEQIQRKGEKAIQKWIRQQIKGTSVSIVLVGQDTLLRPYAQYGMVQSVKQGNSIIGVLIHSIKDRVTQREAILRDFHKMIASTILSRFSLIKCVPRFMTT